MASFLVLEEAIERGNGSYLLIRYAADGTYAGDTWHRTIDDALEQARYEFGDALGRWVDVPPDVEDAWAFIVREVPAFPLTVTFSDGSSLTLESIEDIETELEWCDSEESVGEAEVRDNLGRRVSLRVEALQLIRNRLAE